MVWLDTIICSWAIYDLTCKLKWIPDRYHTLCIAKHAGRFFLTQHRFIGDIQILAKKAPQSNTLQLYTLWVFDGFWNIGQWNTKTVLIRASSTKFCLDLSINHLRPEDHHPWNHMRGWFYQPCQLVANVSLVNQRPLSQSHEDTLRW